METLPKEIIITILQNLSIPSLSKVERLNKHFNTLTKSIYTFKCGNSTIDTPINSINQLFTNPSFITLTEKTIHLKKFLHQTREQYHRINPKVIFQNPNLNCHIKPEYTKKIELHIKSFMDKFLTLLNKLHKDLFILQYRQQMHPKNVEKRLARVDKTVDQLIKFYDVHTQKLISDINYQTEFKFTTKSNGQLCYKVSITPDVVTIKDLYDGTTKKLSYECIYVPDHGAVRDKHYYRFEMGRRIGYSLLIKQQGNNYVHVCSSIDKVRLKNVKSYYAMIYRSDCIWPFVVQDDGTMVNIIDWMDINDIKDTIEFVL